MIPEFIKENFEVILLYLISWITSIIFLYFSITRINFNILTETPNLLWYFFISGIFFLFLPFYKKIKIGKYFEIEREITKTKEELSDFKKVVNQNFSILSTNINTISTISNQIQINIPGLTDLKEAVKFLSEKSNIEIQKSSNEIKEELIIEDEDNIFALTKARVRIEYLLRKILNKKLKTEANNREVKYFTLTQLIREFLEYFPDYTFLENSFAYVRKLGNAAAHAQKIPEGQSQEAIELSARIIAILKNIYEELDKDASSKN